MKSIVASANAFISATARRIGASRIGPPARVRCITSAAPAIAWCAAARVSPVMSSETSNSASARRLSGFDTAQCIQFDHMSDSCSRRGPSTDTVCIVAAPISVFSSR